MELEEVYRRDLKLLIALKVLLEEGSVSKASVRLNLSQSAMSRVLGRLRVMLDDPLFTRQGQHLVPTERAMSLRDGLQEPLEALRILLTPDDFKPELCDQRFVVAATDYAMQTIFPFVLPRIYEEAPNISLDFVPLYHDQLLSQLTTGGGDIALCHHTGSVDPLLQRKLGLVSVFVLLSKSHPLVDKQLTLDDYLSFPHALIAISDGVKALIDNTLRGYPERKMVLRAYYLESALAILDKMPLMITVPADLAYLAADKCNLVIKPLPFEFRPFEYSLIWHPRCEHSASQRWLRDLITEECSPLIHKRIHDMGLA